MPNIHDPDFEPSKPFVSPDQQIQRERRKAMIDGERKQAEDDVAPFEVEFESMMGHPISRILYTRLLVLIRDLEAIHMMRRGYLSVRICKLFLEASILAAKIRCHFSENTEQDLKDLMSFDHEIPHQAKTRF